MYKLGLARLVVRVVLGLLVVLFVPLLGAAGRRSEEESEKLRLEELEREERADSRICAQAVPCRCVDERLRV